jgi:hypothetical protein
LFSLLFRAFLIFPTILWYIPFGISHATTGMNDALCYKCYLNYSDVISNRCSQKGCTL